MGLSRDIEPRRSVVLLPRTEALGMEAMACVLPENDSAWRDLVNAALIDLYDGIDSFRGPYVKIYDRWFGRDSNMVYPLDRATRDYLHQLDIWARLTFSVWGAAPIRAHQPSIYRQGQADEYDDRE